MRTADLSISHFCSGEAEPLTPSFAKLADTDQVRGSARRDSPPWQRARLSVIGGRGRAETTNTRALPSGGLNHVAGSFAKGCARVGKGSYVLHI